MGEKEQLMADLEAEMLRAKAKYPSPVGMMVALMTEVGETSQAILDAKWNGGSWEHVREEAIQVAGLALRIALEGDPTIAVPPDKEDM